jgi:hypothetical protein
LDCNDRVTDRLCEQRPHLQCRTKDSVHISRCISRLNISRKTYDEGQIVITFKTPEAHGAQSHYIPQKNSQAADAIPGLYEKQRVSKVASTKRTDHSYPTLNQEAVIRSEKDVSIIVHVLYDRADAGTTTRRSRQWFTQCKTLDSLSR